MSKDTSSTGGATSVQLTVAEAGSGEVVVALVHGALDRGRSFDRVAEALSSDYKILWWDRRGYGSQQTAPDGPVGIDEHISDVLAILDGRPAVVVGHSFGGVIALGVAARSPKTISAVAAYEASVAWAPGWNDEVMQGVFASADPEAAALRLMFAERYDAMGPDEVKRRRHDAAVFLAEERSVRLEPPYDLSSVRCPVVYGRSDPEVMPAVANYLSRNLSDLELITIPGAGHHAHRTHPTEFAALARRAIAIARP